MIGEALECVVSLDPFRVRRTVKWSECDPAGVVFAANFYVYTLWACELFRIHKLGNTAAQVWTPMKAASLVHHAPLRPGEPFDAVVKTRRATRTTFSLMVAGTSGDRPVFDADLTLICIAPDHWQAVELPAGLRAALEQDMEPTT